MTLLDRKIAKYQKALQKTGGLYKLPITARAGIYAWNRLNLPKLVHKKR